MSSPPGNTPSAAGGGNDPSMEDILASIRRILSEDEAPVPQAAAPAPQPMPGAFHPSSQPALNPIPPATPPSHVLTLDATMMVREPQPAPPIAASAPLAALSAIVSPGMETQVPPMHFAAPMPAPLPQADFPILAEPIAQPSMAPHLTMVETPAAEPSSDSLVAPEAAAAASASMGALMRTLTAERQTSVYRGGPTLEDLVREEMRPLLKQWLDTHLPPMVERLVRVEIERVVSRAVS